MVTWCWVFFVFVFPEALLTFVFSNFLLFSFLHFFFEIRSYAARVPLKSPCYWDWSCVHIPTVNTAQRQDYSDVRRSEQFSWIFFMLQGNRASPNSRKRIICAFLDFLSQEFNVQRPNSVHNNTGRIKASQNDSQRCMELFWDTGLFTIPGFVESVVNQEPSTFQVLLQNYFLLTESHDVPCEF